MTLSRTRTLYWVLFLALAAFALRPVPALEGVLGWLLAPTRVLTELSGPLGWLQGRELLAAGPEDSQRALETRLHVELEEAVLDSAFPDTDLLPAGARAVHAEVIGRPEGELDTIRVRVEDMSGVRRGLPVVSGDAYVGVVASLPDPGDASAPSDVIEVELVTARRARIGAFVDGGPGGESSMMVAGALAPRADAVYLDVHNPASHAARSGTVVVWEPEGLREGWAWLANGFELGELVYEPVYPRGPGGAPIEDEKWAKWVLGIRPRLDYETGLYQVLVLTPDASATPPAPAREDVLLDGRWAPARILLRGEPSAWREGRKLALGRRHGVVPGAALASGARLVGRVLRAGPLTSDCVLLGDPGLACTAIAMVEQAGRRVPHVMGRLASLGREADGTLRFHWPATLPLDGAGALPALLWSGSGERGMPRGLLIGATEVPCGPGPHVLRVRPPDGAREPAGILVRIAYDQEPRP